MVRNQKPTQHHQALVDVVRLLQRFAFAVRLLCHLTAGQIHEIDLALFGDEHAILGLLLGRYVHAQNRVAARRVVVHAMGAHRPVAHALLQHGQQIVQLLAVDGEQVLDKEAARFLRPAHGQRFARRTGVQQIDNLDTKHVGGMVTWAEWSSRWVFKSDLNAWYIYGTLRINESIKDAMCSCSVNEK